jgi:hypothetical protein
MSQQHTQNPVIPEHFQAMNASIAALSQEFYQWLDLLSMHEVPAEMRGPLRQYHAMPRVQRCLTPELLWELIWFRQEDAPPKIQSHLRSLAHAMCEVLAAECPLTVDDGKLTVTSAQTGERFQF